MQPFTDRSMVEYARDWVDRGFAVFPLRPRGKEPLWSLTPHGFYDASKDPAAIRDWWRRQPQANIGLRTGRGHFVVDLDTPAAMSWFTKACNRHHRSVLTLTTHTPRGRHLFFACDVVVPCSTGRLTPGLDIKAEGGYVVAAPSVHPSGSRYSISLDLPIAEAPRWLVDLALTVVRPEPEPAHVAQMCNLDEGAIKRSVAGILALVKNAREGERNQLIFWAACRLAEKVRLGLVDENEARILLEEAGRRTGLPKAEIKVAASNGWRRA